MKLLCATVPIGILAGGIVLAYHEMLLGGFAAIYGDLGDARLVNWILEHTYRWLRQWPGHKSLWNAPIFFPTPNTAAYTELLVGAAWLYWPWRLAGVDFDTAYQLWLLGAGTANFAAMWLFLRRALGVGTLAACGGALLFAFGSPRINQLGHGQLVAQFWTPLALHALVRALSPQARHAGRWLTAFAAATAAQVWSCVYLGWFFLFALGIAASAGVAWPSARRFLLAFVAQHPAAVVGAAITGAAILAPLVAHYLRAAAVVGPRSFDEVSLMLPRWRSWFDIGATSWIWGWTHPFFADLPVEPEHRAGIGVVATIAAPLGLLAAGPRVPARLLLVTSAAVVALATVVPWTGTAPWWIVYVAVPGASAIRAVARIGLLLLVPAAVGLAGVLDRLAARPRGGVVAAGVLALVAAEQLHSPATMDKRSARAQAEAVAARIPPGCRSFYWAAEGEPAPAWAVHVDAMWAQMLTRTRTVNGWSGAKPPGWPLEAAKIDGPADRERVRQALDAWIRRRRLRRAPPCLVIGPSPRATPASE